MAMHIINYHQASTSRNNDMQHFCTTLRTHDIKGVASTHREYHT